MLFAALLASSVIVGASLPLAASSEPPAGSEQGQRNQAAGIAAAIPDRVVLDTPRLPDRSILTESEHANAGLLPDDIILSNRGTDYGYDVDHVHLDLTVNLGSGTEGVEGVSTASVTMLAAGRTQIDFDLDDALDVTAATVNGFSVFFTQNPDHVTVQIGSPSTIGQELDVAIAYEGRPLEVGNKSMRFRLHGASVPLMYTLSTPYSTSTSTVIPISHFWRPCKDVVDDKSTYSCDLTVALGMVGVSNGNLVATTNNGDGTRTYSWEHAYPIAPYLVTVGVTNYLLIQDEYVGPSGTSPIRHYAFPEDFSDAVSDWSVTVPQMHVFADAFGEYPFIGDKFGNYETTSGPAVEHQTAVSTPNTFVNGSGNYDWLNAHELAHMWWGDCLSVRDWDHVWLNEGFASYAEAIWRESLGGPNTLRDYMLNMDVGPYAGTIVDPPHIWNAIVYDKGAWVLHMLRHVLGDDGTFFGMLQAYRTAHEHGNVVTDDFIAAAEDAYGADLSWFFDPWLYREGQPSYTYSWHVLGSPEPSGSGSTVRLRIQQLQSVSYPTYTMPIDVVVTHASGADTFVVVNSARTQDFDLVVSDAPFDVALDPGRWILADFAQVPASVEEEDLAGGFLAPNTPNPFDSQTTIRFGISRTGTVALRVFDVGGRLVRTLLRERVDAGEHTVVWDGRDNSGREVVSGQYLYQLVGPSGVLERRLVLLR